MTKKKNTNAGILKEEFSDIASYALYGKIEEATLKSKGFKPTSFRVKENTGDMSRLTDQSIEEHSNPKLMLVALNEASYEEDDITLDNNKRNHEPWGNFHSSHGHAQDYFIRAATQGTDFEGAYMTDLIKYHPETKSKKVESVRKDKAAMKENLRLFRRELELLTGDSEKPIIIAFGGAVYETLTKDWKLDTEYKVVKVTHYSDYGNADNYREKFEKEFTKGMEKYN